MIYFFSYREVFKIKKLLLAFYLKVLNFINKKCDCLHRIIFVVGGVTGVCFYHLYFNNKIIEASIALLIGGLLIELIHKYLRSKPEVILVTRSKGEKDEEFLNKVQDKVAKTIKEKEKEKNNEK
ncbi:MAG: hypothetical protein ACOC21_01950 [Halanaerobiales bacterium]